MLTEWQQEVRDDIKTLQLKVRELQFQIALLDGQARVHKEAIRDIQGDDISMAGLEE